jgi:hypothetical protein
MAPTSVEVVPLTSGQLSHSSGPLNCGGLLSDSPPVSPEINDTKLSLGVHGPCVRLAWLACVAARQLAYGVRAAMAAYSSAACRAPTIARDRCPHPYLAVDHQPASSFACLAPLAVRRRRKVRSRPPPLLPRCMPRNRPAGHATVSSASSIARAHATAQKHAIVARIDHTCRCCHSRAPSPSIRAVSRMSHA